jgi:hypothetical protein
LAENVQDADMPLVALSEETGDASAEAAAFAVSVGEIHVRQMKNYEDPETQARTVYDQCAHDLSQIPKHLRDQEAT